MKEQVLEIIGSVILFGMMTALAFLYCVATPEQGTGEYDIAAAMMAEEGAE